MPRGYLDTTLIDFPPNIDVNYVRNLTTPKGVSFARVLQLIDQRLAAASAVADPLIAALTTFTTEASVDGTTPTVFALEEENEYGVPRPELGENRGHMLPYRRYAKSLGFTEQGLEEMTEAQVLRQLDNMLKTFVRGGTINVLTRLFSDAEVYVDRKTTSTSPGFAGSGTGDNVFSGTYPDGTALPSNYTHYYRDTSANLASVIGSVVADLLLWHADPFDLVASAAQVSAIKALNDFTDAGSALIVPASGTATATVDRGRYVGVFNDGQADVRVWQARPELGSEPNIAIFKTYGDFDPRNALAWRYDSGFGRGIDVRYRSFFPLDQAFMRQRYGVGVNDRTAAELIRVAASGGYVAPTIS